MAYDDGLAQRIREALKGRRNIEEKKMFGGLAFLCGGNMACGVVGEQLMLRLGNDGAEAARRREHVREMDFTGRSLKSMVYVDPEGFESDQALKSWVDGAIAFARSLPPK